MSLTVVFKGSANDTPPVEAVLDAFFAISVEADATSAVTDTSVDCNLVIGAEVNATATVVETAAECNLVIDTEAYVVTDDGVYIFAESDFALTGSAGFDPVKGVSVYSSLYLHGDTYIGAQQAQQVYATCDLSLGASVTTSGSTIATCKANFVVGSDVSLSCSNYNVNVAFNIDGALGVTPSSCTVSCDFYLDSGIVTVVDNATALNCSFMVDGEAVSYAVGYRDGAKCVCSFAVRGYMDTLSLRNAEVGANFVLQPHVMFKTVGGMYVPRFVDRIDRWC